ncbi:UNVERIFIED_CONTAM: Mob3a [Trichonephila clavipes]
MQEFYETCVSNVSKNGLSLCVPSKKTIFLQTFRPKKKFQQGTLRYSLHKRAQASLDSAVNLQEAVKLPPGENLNDWLAVHVVDFFNRINLIYGTVIDSCTEESCPTMSGGPRYIKIYD